MAVPFHVPEVNAPATSAATTTTSSAVPQPQNPATPISTMSPVNSEYLVQAFCEALYRYSRAGGSLTTPPSPSPTCTTYGNGEMFFNFNSHIDELASPRRFRSHSLSCPMPPRHRLSSQGQEMTDDEDDDADENIPQANYMEEHYNNFMVERERLQEFPGRVPQQRKRKATDSESNPQQYGESEEEKQKNKPKELKFAWPLVALGVLAVGCGLLATTR